MNQCKKGSMNNLTCDVCKIDFNSNADYALHEFSKKHCDNLIRLAKQKPVVSKQKTKSDTLQVEKEPPKVNTVSHTGSFAKYGYFVPGEIYTNPETSREFNTDYDPYLQKFAENPFKEKPISNSTTETTNFCSITSFGKKKKKKIKTCQVCDITLSTVPEYEAHMKSPQHIWRLKVTGMGVSAHFVKASSDLHTTDINDEPKASSQIDDQVHIGTAVTTAITNKELPASGPFPLLYCSDCELLLNSPQQYNSHINGKFHLECAQKKAELKAKKEKLENPSPNQLYCYSCKISLNNLFQYNEHKNGKKHKTKCRNLIKKGITIPPEERVPGIPLQNPIKPVVYPELYEKLVLEKQKETDSQTALKSNKTVTKNFFIEKQSRSSSSSFNDYNENSINVQQSSGYPTDDTNLNSVKSFSDFGIKNEATNNSESLIIPKINFCENSTSKSDLNVGNRISEIVDSEMVNFDLEKDSRTVCSIVRTSDVNEPKKSVTIVADDTSVQCSICNESFQWQSQLDVHFGTEDHYRKILERKMSGCSDSDILNLLFSDRDVVKPNNMNKLTCSICSVTVDSSVEFDQHLNSIVHKYTQKDYKTKRAVEVKHILRCNEEGLYFCKLCKEGWQSLLEYMQHLHFTKHKTIQRAQRTKTVMARRRTAHIQKPRLMHSLKRRNVPLRKFRNGGKNPGVRTKVCGVAVDVNSGTLASIPNLEPLEPKIDPTKNVSIGISKISNNSLLSNNNDNDKAKVPNVKKRYKVTRTRTFSNQRRSGPYHDDVPPFVPSGIPPLMAGPPFQPRFPRLNHAAPNRNWIPFSPPPFGPFCGRPPIGSPYPRPPWSQRHPWPRYR